MEAILIDRNFEFRPQKFGNYVKATIGVVCDDEAQLLLLLNHLSKLDLGAQYQATNIFVNPIEEEKKVKAEEKIQQALEKFTSGPISSLELD